jgi:hypothetical protein
MLACFSLFTLAHGEPFMVIADSCILRIFTVPYAGSIGLLSCVRLWQHPYMISNRTSYRRFYDVPVPRCQNEDVGNHTCRIEDGDMLDTAVPYVYIF